MWSEPLCISEKATTKSRALRWKMGNCTPMMPRISQEYMSRGQKKEHSRGQKEHCVQETRIWTPKLKMTSRERFLLTRQSTNYEEFVGHLMMWWKRPREIVHVLSFEGTKRVENKIGIRFSHAREMAQRQRCFHVSFQTEFRRKIR